MFGEDRRAAEYVGPDDPFVPRNHHPEAPPVLADDFIRYVLGQPPLHLRIVLDGLQVRGFRGDAQVTAVLLHVVPDFLLGGLCDGGRPDVMRGE